MAKFSKPLHHFRADETKRMVDASAQPHIVVTLEPNPWAAFYFDINIAKEGANKQVISSQADSLIKIS
ncbi:TPA: hypothetical protein ACUKEC_004741, partial [Escherichia coli]